MLPLFLRIVSLSYYHFLSIEDIDARTRGLLYLDTLQSVPSFHLSLNRHFGSINSRSFLFFVHHQLISTSIGRMCENTCYGDIGYTYLLSRTKLIDVDDKLLYALIVSSIDIKCM